MIPVMAAGVVDTGTAVGAGGLLALLFGYLFKELRRKDDGVWQIIADRDKQHLVAMTEREKEIQRLVNDRDFWRDRVLKEEDAAHRAVSWRAADDAADQAVVDDAADEGSDTSRKRRADERRDRDEQ